MSDQNDQRRPGEGGEGGDHDGCEIGTSVVQLAADDGRLAVADDAAHLEPEQPTARPTRPADRSLPVRYVLVLDHLYPRAKHNRAAIDDYFDSLDQLPPIVVARGRVLVDGWHRLQAHKKAGRKTIVAQDLGDLTDDQILAEAIRRNATHGHGLTGTDRRALVGRLWTSGRDHAEQTRELAELLAVTERTVRNWTDEIRKAELDAKRQAVAAKKRKATALHQSGRTQRAIADELAVSQSTVRDWLSASGKAPESTQPLPAGSPSDPDPDALAPVPDEDADDWKRPNDTQLALVSLVDAIKEFGRRATPEDVEHALETGFRHVSEQFRGDLLRCFELLEPFRAVVLGEIAGGAA